MKRLPVILAALLLACAGVRAQALDGTTAYRILCLLVAFEDQPFSVEEPAAYFEAMLNEEGFSEEGAAGSVRDYYSENSAGLFIPAFDLAGPVVLPQYYAFYGRNLYEGGVRVGDAAAEQMIADALAALELDPSAYDAVYCIYAGYDESQGGPADAVWAHQAHSDSIGDYACSAELSGGSGGRLSGIGPVCHEIGHLLGLPDFYDTDDAEEGLATGPGMYSLMGTGAHNRDGRQPPYLNALELMLLGWMPEIPELPEGKVELLPVQHFQAFRSPAATEGEFFLYECRSGQGWDAGLPGGLLIYHVDQTDLERWAHWRLSNKLNSNALHPCFYPIRSSAPQLSLKADASLVGGNLVFPGLSRNYSYEPQDWEEQYTGLQITNIDWNGTSASFYVLRDDSPNINGMVRDINGKALQGAVLTIDGLDGYAVSDADGFFRFPLEEDDERQLFYLTATMADCRPSFEEVARNHSRTASVPVVLRKLGEADDSSLSKFDRHAQFGYFPQAQIGAVRFSPADLAPYVGRLLTEITFYPYLEPSFEGELYVTVDIGEERVLQRKVEVPAVGMYFQNTVDVSDEGIVIPEGEVMYIGTGSDAAGSGYYLGTVYPASSGSSFWTEFEAGLAWKPLYVEKAGFYMDVALSTRVKEQAGVADLSDLGYAYIEDPGGGHYPVGSWLPLNVVGAAPETPVAWFLDGKPVDGDRVLLTKGEHLLQAQLDHKPGRKESLQLKIKVTE